MTSNTSYANRKYSKNVLKYMYEYLDNERTLAMTDVLPHPACP